MKKEITCRYGVTYSLVTFGTRGEQKRLWDLLGRCCCWVCHNRHCETPRNEVFPDCGKACELYTKQPYCEERGKQ